VPTPFLTTTDAFLVCLTILFCFPYFVYPAVLKLLVPRTKAGSVTRRSNEKLPTVTLVICALNEEGVIGEKIVNSLALDYPSNRLKILVISDGSTDRTAEICRQYASEGIVFVDRRERRGKAWNLNEIIPALKEEIAVLSDANVLYQADAVKELVARFKEPTVGCVSGKVVLTGTTDLLRLPETSYYSIEWSLQARESELYSMVSADGAMYAIRRELFVPFPTDTILDDLAIPLGVLKSGKRIIFAETATGWESGPSGWREEFNRKVRIAAGAAQALVRGWGWPTGCPARLWFVFVSHKLLRWISPWVGAIALLTAVLTWQQTLSRVLLTGAVLLVAGAGIRFLARKAHPVLDAMFYFVMAQVALAVGAARGLSGGQSVLWKKENR